MIGFKMFLVLGFWEIDSDQRNWNQTNRREPKGGDVSFCLRTKLRCRGANKPKPLAKICQEPKLFLLFLS